MKSGFKRLHDYLAALPQQQSNVRLTYPEIETILGESLPTSAYDGTWWFNSDCGSNTPESYAWLEAGFGIDAVVETAKGWVVFTRGLHKWSGEIANSRPLGKMHKAERHHQLALGYLQSARILCIRLGENPSELNWPRASVVRFCYRHAVELFLKACILHRTLLSKCNHDISDLKNQYHKLYPQPECNFKTPYDTSLAEIEKSVGHYLGEKDKKLDIEDFERHPDQVYRYLSGRNEQSPKGLYSFSPGPWLSMIERLEHDINRIWNYICIK